MTGGDRVRPETFRARREALGITAESFYKMARISRRALTNAEKGDAGPTVTNKVENTLRRLEAGEPVAEEAHVMRVEFRPGVWVTVDADNVATLGDLREVEQKIRRLIDNGA